MIGNFTNLQEAQNSKLKNILVFPFIKPNCMYLVYSDSLGENLHFVFQSMQINQTYFSGCKESL